MSLKPLNRRQFLKGSSTALSSILLSSCGGGINKNLDRLGMQAYQANSSPYIDMHCHIMNMRDSVTSEFLERYFRKGGILHSTFNWLGKSVQVNAYPSDDEYQILEDTIRQYHYFKTDQAFYNFANNLQFSFFGSLFKAKGDQRITGFLSHRSRNAALLMSAFPEVNIFTPAMVDFYDGESKHQMTAYTLFNQVKIYSYLNLLTRGRLLPMVSYSPGRQADESSLDDSFKMNTETLNRNPAFKEALSPLGIVKEAVEKYGFVGVKVHPSSGFTPYNNETYGFNAYGTKMSLNRAKKINHAMMQLFHLCKQLDVPILTHAGHGNLDISNGMYAHHPEPEQCMTSEGLNNPSDIWTHSPKHWLEATKAIDEKYPDLPPLRLCLAHFSGGFVYNNGDWQPHCLLDSALECMAQNPNIHIDISDMPEFFKKPSIEGVKTSIQDTYNHQDRFIDLFKQHPLLLERTLYGSDWHMPQVAMMGSEYFNQFKTLFEGYKAKALNIDSQKILGKNAVQFLGLYKEHQTRKRLECFYKGKVDYHHIDWMKYDL